MRTIAEIEREYNRAVKRGERLAARALAAEKAAQAARAASQAQDAYTSRLLTELSAHKPLNLTCG